MNKRIIVTDRYHCETRPHEPFLQRCPFDADTPQEMIDEFMRVSIEHMRCPATGAQFDPAKRVSRRVEILEEMYE